jgi:hypothetical protein
MSRLPPPVPDEDDYVNVAVTIPDGVKAGSTLYVNVAGCHKPQIEVVVPSGLQPGETFSVKVLAAYRQRARLLGSITQARGLARFSAAAGLLPFSNVHVDWSAVSAAGKILAKGKTRTVPERTPDPIFDVAVTEGTHAVRDATSSMFLLDIGVNAKNMPRPIVLRCKVFAGDTLIGNVKVPVRGGRKNLPIDLWYNVTMIKVSSSSAASSKPSKASLRRGSSAPAKSKPVSAGPPPQLRLSYMYFDADELHAFNAESIKAQQALLELRQEAYRRKVAQSEKEGANPPAHVMDAEKQALVDHIASNEHTVGAMRAQLAALDQQIAEAEARRANLEAGGEEYATGSAVAEYTDADYGGEHAGYYAEHGGGAGTPWRAIHDASSGTHYYHNAVDGTTAWELPEGFLGTPAADWVSHTHEESGESYYVNIATGVTTWDLPPELA